MSHSSGVVTTSLSDGNGWAGMEFGGADDIGVATIETRAAPIWILLIAVGVDLDAIATRVFLGGGGAVAGCVLGLLAFGMILVFRRAYGLLSERYYVEAPSLEGRTIPSWSETPSYPVIDLQPSPWETSSSAELPPSILDD